MIKTRHNFFRVKSNAATGRLSLLFLLVLFSSQLTRGQQSIGTGQYDGGFENALFNTAQLSQTTPDATKWSHDSSTNLMASGSESSIKSDGNARSGSKYFNIINSVAATGKYIMSPVLSPALTNSTNYVVQYYVKTATTSATKGAIYVSTRGSGAGTQGTADSNGWQKVTYRYTGVATAAGTYTWAGFGPNVIATFNANVDDFVVYVGSGDDNTAPDAPTSPTATGLAVSWTAPATGVDGGGYMVVRYATNPNADNDPNVNGIYAVGNTITNGTGSLVGTVVYLGTATSFNDAVAGSVSGSDYYKIYTVDKAFNYSSEITVTAGGAATTTTWNGTTWSSSAPSSTVEAIIDGDYSTATNGAISAKKLTVNATKTLTVNSGTKVTVQNEVINNGMLTVENNANLIQVNNTTNTGNITVKRDSNPLSRLDYTLWSSPVTGTQTLAAFSPLTSQSPSRFYTYDASTNLYVAVATPTSTTFSAGTGYLIRMPNTAVSYPSTETFSGMFTGVPNNGNVSLTSLTSDAFYAVGNPYPSVLSADAFLNANTAAATLYFWRKTNGVVGSAYATYTLAGGAGTSPGSSSITPNGSIQVGQGFIVKTGASATSLNFTNAMRETSPTSTQFLKIAKSQEKSRIWLNLTNKSGVFSQALVAYMNGATEGVDNGIDGKYINDSQVALTSNINGEEYTIQGRPAFDTSDVVALNFKTDKDGEYVIGIDHTDGLFAKGQAVYLTDNTTGTETNLNTSSYTFTAKSGTDNSRFTLKYESSSKTVGSPVFDENTVTVFRNNGTLYVNSAASAIVTVKVFDLQGKLISVQKDVNSNSVAIKNLKANHQVVIVQVTSEDNKVVNKKVVN